MSEIFKFLKQTGTEKEEQAPASETEIEAGSPASEPSVQSFEQTPEDVPILAPATAVEMIPSDKFELSNADRQLKVSLDPFTIVGEQFRLLRTKLGVLKKEKGIKTVLVTSSVPEEGKTFASSSLAGVFAQEPGKRVVLIDCDLRKPKSGWNLGLNGTSGTTGMSEVLQGHKGFFDILLRSADSDFYFMPSGPLAQNPTELLSSPLLEKTIKTAADTFDWVVIDSPPVLSLSDATLLAPLCDTVVLVVRANSTPSKLIKDTIDQIGRDKICGVVFNRQKQRYPSRYYYKYYHNYHKNRKE